MRNLLVLFVACLLTLNVFSQTLKKTYYDEYAKTMLKESYYVNSAGYGDGAYKKYWKDGNLTLKGTYKNGSKEGVWTSYSRSSGKQQISQTETFKGNDLNGPAVYYASDKNGRRIMSQGSYLNGEKHGKWSFINPFDSYGYSDQDKKGAKYLKFDKHFDNGKEIFPDGDMKIYYSPSGQVQTHGQYLDGMKTGEWNWYFPSGKTQAITGYKKDKMVGKRIIYNIDGSIKLEEYYEDFGALSDMYLDSALIAMEKYEFEEAEQYFTKMKSSDDANRMKYMSNAATLRGQEKYLESIVQINLALKGIQNPTMQSYWQEVYKEYISVLDSNFAKLIKYESTEGLNNELTRCQDAYNKNAIYKEDLDRYTKMVDDYQMELKRKEDELKQLDLDVNSSIDSYKTNNVTQVQTIMVDTDGKPIMKDSYIKGKFIYKKSMIVLLPMIQEFNEESDLDKKKILGQKITDAIEILNNIPESEWKGLNKELKKVDDPEQIKAILKI